jgi:hypothetical protein
VIRTDDSPFSSELQIALAPQASYQRFLSALLPSVELSWAARHQEHTGAMLAAVVLPAAITIGTLADRVPSRSRMTSADNGASPNSSSALAG